MAKGIQVSFCLAVLLPTHLSPSAAFTAAMQPPCGSANGFHTFAWSAACPFGAGGPVWAVYLSQLCASLLSSLFASLSSYAGSPREGHRREFRCHLQRRKLERRFGKPVSCTARAAGASVSRQRHHGAA